MPWDLGYRSFGCPIEVETIIGHNPFFLFTWAKILKHFLFIFRIIIANSYFITKLGNFYSLHHFLKTGGKGSGLMFFDSVQFDSMFYNLMFSLFPFIFLVVFAIIIFSIFSNIKQGIKNNQSPLLTVPAKVITKRIQVRGDHSHTTYYVTFEVQSGDRMELKVNGQEYGMLVENDVGLLSFQGTRYVSFERQKS